MSSLFLRSRCLRMNHLQLHQLNLKLPLHRHIHRRVRASALGILNLRVGVGPRVKGVDGPGCSGYFVGYARGVHGSARVEFPQPKARRKGITSSRARPKLASPSSVASSSRPNFRPSSSSNSRSNYDSKPNYNSRPAYNSKPYYNSKPNFNSEPNFNSKPNPSSASSSSSPPRPKTSRWQPKNKELSHWQLRGHNRRNKELELVNQPSRPTKAELNAIVQAERAGPPKPRVTPRPKMPSPRVFNRLLGERLATTPDTSASSSGPSSSSVAGPASHVPEFDPSTSAQLDAELGKGVYRRFPADYNFEYRDDVEGASKRPRGLTRSDRKKLAREEKRRRREARLQNRVLYAARKMDPFVGERGKDDSPSSSSAMYQGQGQEQYQERGQRRSRPSEREDQQQDHSSPSSPAHAQAQAWKPPQPSEAPSAPLDFSNRRERQRDWSSTMQSSWSTVGYGPDLSISSRKHKAHSNDRRRDNQQEKNDRKRRDSRGIDTRSLALLARNPRARFSPTAWAGASRFAAPVPTPGGRLGVSAGIGGATSRYLRSVDMDRMMRRRAGAVGAGAVGGKGMKVFGEEDFDAFEVGGDFGYTGARGGGGYAQSQKEPYSAPATARVSMPESAPAPPRVSRHMDVDRIRSFEEGQLQPREHGHGQYERGGDQEFYYPPKPVTSISSDGTSASAALTPSPSNATSKFSSQSTKRVPDATDSGFPLSSSETAQTFSSPPLLPGFLSALREMFGESVKPSLIQGLSVRWVLEGFGNRFLGFGRRKEVQQDEDEELPAQNAERDAQEEGAETGVVLAGAGKAIQPYRQFLLAAETGSGKSIAYLLPLLQNLKLTEPLFKAYHAKLADQRQRQSQEQGQGYGYPTQSRTQRPKSYEHTPRALILAPTHELARQLAGFAKDLLHFPDTKLRVLCASAENTLNVSREQKWEKRREDVRRRVGKAGGGWTKEGMFEGVVFDNELKVPGAGAGETQGSSTDGNGSSMASGIVGSVEEGQGRRMPADVMVGTPIKLLEMVWGRGRDKIMYRALDASKAYTQASAVADAAAHAVPGPSASGPISGYSGTDPAPSLLEFGPWRTRSELGLENVEYVVVDEADVLFDRDFEETTRLLLADVAAARGHPVPYILKERNNDLASSSFSSSSSSIESAYGLPQPPKPVSYPFNLILTSATIPSTLNTYLTHAHPGMIRLASPRLHKLPKGLSTEYVNWTGGNKWRDVLYRLKRVWAEDAMAWNAQKAHDEMMEGEGSGTTRLEALLKGRARAAEEEAGEEEGLSKVVIFCNSSTRVEDLSQYLEENGVSNVPVTSASPNRRRRSSNKYLAGFLRVQKSGKTGAPPKPRKWGGMPWTVRKNDASDAESGVAGEGQRGEEGRVSSFSSSTSSQNSKAKGNPRVLITTSLLSRGLDFSPEIKHVFIIDEPRNMIDFLHRAGRVGRAGEKGTVVVFGKMSGRGSARFRDVKAQVGRLGRKY